MSKLLTSKIRLNEGYQDKVKQFGLIDAIKKDIENSEEPEREYNKEKKNAELYDYFARTASNFLAKKLQGLKLLITANDIYSGESKPVNGEEVSKTENYTTYITEHSSNIDDYYYVIENENTEIDGDTVVMPNPTEYSAVPNNLFEILINAAQKYANDNSGLFKVVKLLTPATVRESKEEKYSKKMNESGFLGDYAMVTYSSNLDEFELKAYIDYESARRAMEFQYTRSGENGELFDEHAVFTLGNKQVAIQLINLSAEKGYILIKYDIEREEFTVESFEGASSARTAMEVDFEENGGNNNFDDIDERTAKIEGKYMWEIVQNK